MSLPVAFLLLHRRYTEKLIYGLLRVVNLDLFGIVVFVLDSDVPRLIFVCVFVFKVIPRSSVSQHGKGRMEDV